MFSIVIPTRGRPKLAENLIKSVKNTQVFTNEILFYISEDDPVRDEYLSMFEKNKFSTYYVGRPYDCPILWNILAARVSNEYIILCGDDVLFKTKGWDEKILNKFNEYPDNIYVGGCQELPLPVLVKDYGSPHNWPYWNITCHPIMHIKLAEILGYFVPPYFRHNMIDVWMSFLGIGLGRYFWFNDIRMEHFVKDLTYEGDGITDEVYSRTMNGWYKWKSCYRHFRTDIDLVNSHMDTPISDEQIEVNLSKLSNDGPARFTEPFFNKYSFKEKFS